MTTTRVLDSGGGVIDPDTYFDLNPPPNNLAENERRILEFVNFHREVNNRVVLVTSGGTTVPLENQTVRFIDNFSAGTRGATSAEYFLQLGYAVIFLHRSRSMQPYSRSFTHSTTPFLDFLAFSDDSRVVANPDYESNLSKMLRKHREARNKNVLLFVEFTTIADYLFLLRSATGFMSLLKENAMYYLAAAVSDFFIPGDKMIEHKIQSQAGPLTLRLDQVPKFLKSLVSRWAPKGFIVSFKLETDAHLLSSKSLAALMRYGHQVVIANLLTTRKHSVTMITLEDEMEIRLTPEEMAAEVEIEGKIVSELIRRHGKWIEDAKKAEKARVGKEALESNVGAQEKEGTIEKV